MTGLLVPVAVAVAVARALVADLPVALALLLSVAVAVAVAVAIVRPVTVRVAGLMGRARPGRSSQRADYGDDAADRSSASWLYGRHVAGLLLIGSLPKYPGNHLLLPELADGKADWLTYQ